MPELSCATEVSAPHESAIPYRHAEPVSNLSVAGSLGATCLLLGGVVVTWFIARRHGVRLPFTQLRHQRIRVLETTHLSTRTKLHLVEVDSRCYLIADGKSGLAVTKCEPTSENENRIDE